MKGGLNVATRTPTHFTVCKGLQVIEIMYMNTGGIGIFEFSNPLIQLAFEIRKILLICFPIFQYIFNRNS